MKGKGWAFFNESVSLYKMRLQKADSIIKSFLSKPVDCSKTENFIWPPLGFAGSEIELAQRWQKYLKWRLMAVIAEQVEDSLKDAAKTPINFKELELAAREKLKKNEHRYISNLISTPENFVSGLQDNYLNCIAWCYDPHSSYMNLKEKKEFETEMSASEFSAGIGLDENDKGESTIDFLQPGGSAWRSGQLHKGDVITKVKINGQEKSVAEMEEDELDDMLNSKEESDLSLTVKTPAGESKTVKLHKEKVVNEESVVKSYVIQGKKNIGYISLPGFYSREEEGAKEINYNGCANDVSKEIVKLKKDSIAGLVLDVRFNGGGSMWEAMQLAGIFIDIGPVASVKDKDGKVYFLKDPNRGTIYDGPMIVLINGASASASEFLSAALQDYNRAVIMGDKTYGKGTAQIVMPMDTNKVDISKQYEDFVKVTQKKFYRVNGGTTQWAGVQPDIELPGVFASDKYKEKANASALLPDKSKVGVFEKLPPLPLASLADKSAKRVAVSAHYKAVNNLIQWQAQYEKGRTIPLQWNNYYAQYLDAKKMFKQVGGDSSVNTGLLISNNHFDTERILQSTERSKEINAVYLEQLKTDQGIFQAYQVFMDWLGQ